MSIVPRKVYNEMKKQLKEKEALGINPYVELPEICYCGNSKDKSNSLCENCISKVVEELKQ